jgi:hypothetical protein
VTVTAWTASFEASDSSEWSGGTGGNVSYTSSAPAPAPDSGSVAGVSVCETGTGTDFARWIKSDVEFDEGDSIFYGYYLWIPAGFYDMTRSSSTRLAAIDNFNVEATNTDRLGLWVASDDDIVVNRQRDGVETTEILSVGAGQTYLPEDTWNLVEMQFVPHRTDGQAVIRVWVDAVLVGENTTVKNLHADASFPMGRFRGGITDISWNRASDVTMYTDGFYIDTYRHSAETSFTTSRAGSKTMLGIGA